MIIEGRVPTLTVDEVRHILESLNLEVVKTANTRENLGVKEDLLLTMGINALILEKSETPDA